MIAKFVACFDESVHIGSPAFHLVGYTHVIAILWPIGDALATSSPATSSTAPWSREPSQRRRCTMRYARWLADDLVADGAEGRIVVAEDVSTFSAAIALVPEHIGVVYCHHGRFSRTRQGLNLMRKALVALAAEPPPGLGEHPVIWWLAAGD